MNLSVKKNTLAISALVITALVIVLLISSPSQATGTLVDGSGDLFKAKCAACHGPDGSGGTPMGKKFNLRDLRSAEVQKQSDVQLSSIVAKGKDKMPAFEKSLAADQIKQLVTHVRELGKKR